MMTAATTSKYVYKDLGNQYVDVNEDFKPLRSFKVRIIELEPAQQTSDDLRCRVEHVELAKFRDYSAISYVWGEPVFSKVLHCENTTIAITPTLDVALRRFRDKKERKRLWADAVCINQKDRKELSQQVQHMSLIYTSARSVLVWLGDGPDMDKCINFLWGLSSSRHESSVTAERADSSIKEELTRFFGHIQLGAVQRFFALPWFRRRWIVQEVASGAHFYCGSVDISSHAFQHAMYVLNKSSFPFDRVVLDHITSLEDLSEHYEQEDEKDRLGGGILDILVRFSHPACSDERDRIYAYLGLANDVRLPYANISTPTDRWAMSWSHFDFNDDLGDSVSGTQSPRSPTKIGIPVDYEAETKQVYVDFAEQMLRHKGHLDILHCAGAFRSRLDSMPDPQQSWAPDWRIPMRYRPLLSVPWFVAGGPDVKEEPFLNYPWCSVKGFSFDTVAVSCKVPGLDTTHARDTRVMPPVGKLCTALNMRGKYITGERIWQVLGLTWIADHALNYQVRKCYTDSKDTYGLTGKRVKRNVSERDMHTLLDWWTETQESGLNRSTPAKLRASTMTSKAVIQTAIRPHIKSLHRTESIGCFIKTAQSGKEWGPTSYEQQSHHHARVSDETERYFTAWMLRMANKTNPEPEDGTPNHKIQSTGKQKRLTNGPAKTGGVVKGGKRNRDNRDMTVGQGPDDEPYDCEWRLRDEGWVCFEPHERNLERYAELAHNTLRGRSLFVTSKGYIGIGPDDIAPGDTVAVLYGARTPFILRKSHHPGRWRLAGDCYVHGIMGGEALEMDLGPDRQFVFI